MTDDVMAALTDYRTDFGGRREIHNACVDEQVAGTGACGHVHLPTGRTCILRHRHDGPCHLVARADALDSFAPAARPAGPG